ncbi:MAG: oxygenase MpaB family protein [Acidimicrobiia bacterium]
MTTAADDVTVPGPGTWVREPAAAPLRPGSPLRRYASEPVLLAGAQRALLLQLAHPKVATGVDDHSRFRRTPIRRLVGTADKVLTIVWGEGREPQAAWESIMEVHDRIHGELHYDAGTFARGERYTAHDPRLLLWVWATLVDTVEVVAERYTGGLAAGEREGLYADWVAFADFFGIPAALVPPDRETFDIYWTSMLEGDELAVSPTALSVSKSILNPPVPLAPRLLKAELAALAVGLLPQRIREMYGFEWDERRRRRFDRVDAAVRAVYPRLPALRRAAPPLWMGAKHALLPRWRRLSRTAA